MNRFVECLHEQPKACDRVVVLGCNGFIGSALSTLLRRAGTEVLGLGKSDCDLLQPESARYLAEVLRPTDSLVVISALTPDRGKDVATAMANLRMMEQVCLAMQTAQPAHLVYVSSDAVYTDPLTVADEASPCDPGSLHGIMHITREKFLLEAVKEKRIPLLRARPVAVYGGADTHNSYGPNRFLRTALSKGKIQLFGNGEEKRDHLFIHDCCELLRRCLESRCTGVLNLATGSSPSFFHVATTVKNQLGGPCEIECLPRGGPVTHRHYRNTEVRRLFPTFAFTPLAEGIRASLSELNNA